MRNPAQSISSSAGDRKAMPRPSAIHPSGFLIAFSCDGEVVSLSSNVDEFVGRPAPDLLGDRMDDVFKREVIHGLRNRFMQIQGTAATERVCGLHLLGHSTALFDCTAHHSGDLAIVDAEPGDSVKTTEMAGLTRSMTKGLDTAADIDTFIRQGTRQMQILTGFDRVMACRFNADGSGEVVAVSARRAPTRFTVCGSRRATCPPGPGHCACATHSGSSAM